MKLPMFPIINGHQRSSAVLTELSRPKAHGGSPFGPSGKKALPLREELCLISRVHLPA
jgi:hypothetical protein